MNLNVCKVYTYIILATESISDTLSLSNVYIICNFLASLACCRRPVIIHCSEVSSHCDVDRIHYCLLFILWESSWMRYKWLSWRKASAHSSKKLCMEVQASKNVPLSMPPLYGCVEKVLWHSWHFRLLDRCRQQHSPFTFYRDCTYTWGMCVRESDAIST